MVVVAFHAYDFPARLLENLQDVTRLHELVASIQLTGCTSNRNQYTTSRYAHARPDEGLSRCRGV